MATTTSLKGVTDINQSLLSEQLRDNLIEFFNYGLLGVGGFFDVRLAGSGAYGGSPSTLRMSEDPYFYEGQVWEGFRKDWVWESGVNYSRQPIGISGVWVNGGFQPMGATGVYAHNIDYPNGRVVFDNPIPASSVVQCEYSYRYFHFAPADVPWWRKIQFDSFRVDDSQFAQTGSGAWSVLAENRIQLPAVVVEPLADVKRVPYELGSTASWAYQGVRFHILAETPSDRNRIHDVLTYQKDKTIESFDLNQLAANDAFPLTNEGFLASGAKTYAQLVAPSGQGGYPWKGIRFRDINGEDQGELPPLYYGTVRGLFELIMP